MRKQSNKCVVKLFRFRCSSFCFNLENFHRKEIFAPHIHTWTNEWITCEAQATTNPSDTFGVCLKCVFREKEKKMFRRRCAMVTKAIRRLFRHDSTSDVFVSYFCCVYSRRLRVHCMAKRSPSIAYIHLKINCNNIFLITHARSAISNGFDYTFSPTLSLCVHSPTLHVIHFHYIEQKSQQNVDRHATRSTKPSVMVLC